jgi:protocatechuate 3,4-dioxygenase beta subunit
MTMRALLLGGLLASHVLDVAAAGEVLSGRVIGTNGRPIAGATVKVHGREQPEEEAARRAGGRDRTPLASVRTGADGTFRVETAAQAIWIEARAEGQLPAMTMPANEGGTTLVLGAAEMRRGVVRGDGRPVAGALVMWTGNDGAEVFARTAADGSYDAPDPAKVAGHLSISHPDFAVSWADASESSGLDHELDKGIAVAGVVVDAAGKPVPNASLWIDAHIPAGQSDATGAFRIPHAMEGWEFVSARAGMLAGAAPRRNGRIVVKVRPAATLTGSVRDAATGQPLLRATVVATNASLDLDVEADTDARGNYLFKGLPPARYRLYAGRPGYVSGPADYATAEPLDMRSVGAGRRDFTLKALPRARGRVVDAEQRPVDGALVALGFKSTPNIYSRWISGSSGEGETAWTGADGAFSLVLPDPAAAGQFGAFARDRIVAMKEGYAAAQVETSRMASGPLRVVLTRGVELSGRVTTAEGTPVAGAAVSAAEDGAVMGTMIPTHTLLARGDGREGWTATDANGRFTLRVHPVVHHLSFHKAGHAPKVVRGHDAATGQALSVVLDPAAAVRGRVVRSDGRGVAGVSLALVDTGSSLSIGSGVTSADGTFDIGDLAAGAYELTATHPELGIRETLAVEAPAAGVQITLAPRGAVRGRVVESASRRPVTRFTVGVRSYGGHDRTVPGEDAAGAFSIDDVPLGTASLMVTAEGFATRRIEEIAITADGEPPEVEVALDAEAALAGRVTSERGESVPAATVSAQGEGTVGAAAVSDEDGAFELRGVTAGELKLEIRAAGFTIERRTVDTRLVKRIEVALRKGLVLRGEVIAEGAGLPQARVEATSSGRDAEDQNTLTDERGRFTLEGLVPGRYTVRASAQGMKVAEAADVEVEQTGSLRLVLERARTAVLTGRVVGVPSGGETAMAVVMAIGKDAGTTAQALVDATHTFRMEDAPVGRVQVQAMWMTSNASTMRPSRPVELTLAAGTETETVLEFASDVSIKGVVVRGGSPVPNAIVSFTPAGRSEFGTMGQTDARGAYVVEGLDPGAHKVVVYGNNLSYSIDYVVTGSAELDIDVTGATVRGRVTRADTGAPISGADVLFFVQGERETSPAAKATTGGQGGFSQASLRDGRYRLVTSKAGFGQEQREVEVARGSSAEVTFELQPADGVSVSVVDARDGRALEATVVVRDQARRIVANSHSGVGEDGVLNIPLANGSYLLSTSATGYGTATLPVTAPSRGLRVGLTPGGTLRIESPRDLRGRVRLVKPDGEEYVRCWCNGIADIELGGRVTTVENVTPGSYILELVGAEPAATRPVVIQEGQVTTVPID